MTKDEALKMAIETMEATKLGDMALGFSPSIILDDTIDVCKDTVNENPKRTYEDKDKVYLAINVMHKDKLIHLLRIQRNEDKKYYIELNDLIRFINMGNSKKEWQGLTDDEIEEIVDCPVNVMWSGDYETYRAIEQALKQKNT
jgi:hypothetical protein